VTTVGEQGNEATQRRWWVRHGGRAGGTGRGQPGEIRRPGVRASDVLAALALVTGIVLGLGSWRTYLAEREAAEGGAAVEGQGRALVKPNEIVKPMAGAANSPLRC